MSSGLSKQTEGMEKPRKIARGWPPKRRREQAMRIRRQRPWRFSTGPRTAQGRARVRFNAITHGNRRYVWRELRHVLKEHRRMVRELNQWMVKREHYLRRARKVKKILQKFHSKKGINPVAQQPGRFCRVASNACEAV